ncbi:MAG: TolC family protein [Nitrospinota bacterium]
MSIKNALLLFGAISAFVIGNRYPVYAEEKPVIKGANMAAARTELHAQEPTGIITLREALTYGLLNNPELKAFSLEKRAKDALALQAGFLPNPEVAVEAENLAGSGPFTGLEQTETTLQLSQLIELAGKRLKRKRVASLESDLAVWDYEVKKLDISLLIAKAFIDVLTSQRRLVLMNESTSLAGQVFNTVAQRVKAGKVSPVEEIKAGVILSTARIELNRAKRELAAAMKKLANLWGSDSPKFESVSGKLEKLVPLPPEKDLANRIFDNPDIARFPVEKEHRSARVELEKARKTPDLTVGGGIRSFNETNDSALVMGVSIPIPVFNRNKGEIAAAEYDLLKVREERRAVELRIKAELAESYMSLSASFVEASTLKNNVLPGAQKAFEATREGYLQGKFGFLDVLDSQRTLFEVRGQYINALASNHKAVADVERLIGGSIISVNSGVKEVE